MKRVLCILILATLFFTSSAMGSPRVGHNPTGMCTRDFNPWGHASTCSCDNNAIYDERAGLCFTDGETEKITVQGPVSAGMAAIGGETTGVVLETADNITYELIVTVADREKLQKISGMWFEVTGDFINITSVTRGERRAIIVDTLGVLE